MDQQNTARCVVLVLLGAVAANAMTLPVLQTGTLKPSFKAVMNEGGSAAVQVRLAVSAKGVVADCRKAFVNGPTQNVDAFCSMLRSRQFAPARDALGTPTFGVIYIWSHWNHGVWTGSKVPNWSPPDLALETNRMPKGFAVGSLFRLIVQADAKGAIQNCAVLSSPLPADVQEMLCREAGMDPVMPATDDSGTEVASVQEFIVRLTPKSTMDAIMKRLQRK